MAKISSTSDQGVSPITLTSWPRIEYRLLQALQILLCIQLDCYFWPSCVIESLLELFKETLESFLHEIFEEAFESFLWEIFKKPLESFPFMRGFSSKKYSLFDDSLYWRKQYSSLEVCDLLREGIEFLEMLLSQEKVTKLPIDVDDSSIPSSLTFEKKSNNPRSAQVFPQTVLSLPSDFYEKYPEVLEIISGNFHSRDQGLSKITFPYARHLLRECRYWLEQMSNRIHYVDHSPTGSFQIDFLMNRGFAIFQDQTQQHTKLLVEVIEMLEVAIANAQHDVPILNDPHRAASDQKEEDHNEGHDEYLSGEDHDEYYDDDEDDDGLMPHACEVCGEEWRQEWSRCWNCLLENEV
jgi:hypothetical protein